MRLIRYFLHWPGILIPIVCLFLLAGGYITKHVLDQQEEARKRLPNYGLGQINPPIEGDATKAPKEVIIDRRDINPVPQTVRALPPPASNSTPPPTMTTAPSPPVVLTSFVFHRASAPAPSPVSAASGKASKAQRDPTIWLSRCRLIPCHTTFTIETSHMNVPVQGQVDENVYEVNGTTENLVIPQGAWVSCWANRGSVRDRLEVAGTWSITFADGKECEVEGVACFRDADPTNQHFGLENGTSGIQGTIESSDHLAQAQAFLALLIHTAAQTGQMALSSALAGPRTGIAFQVPDTTPFIDEETRRLFEGRDGDARFVRVRADTQFYLVTRTIVAPEFRSVGGQGSLVKPEEEEPQETREETLDPAVRQAVQTEERILKASQALNAAGEQKPQQTEGDSPRFKY